MTKAPAGPTGPFSPTPTHSELGGRPSRRPGPDSQPACENVAMKGSSHLAGYAILT